MMRIQPTPLRALLTLAVLAVPFNGLVAQSETRLKEIQEQEEALQRQRAEALAELQFQAQEVAEREALTRARLQRILEGGATAQRQAREIREYTTQEQKELQARRLRELKALTREGVREDGEQLRLLRERTRQHREQARAVQERARQVALQIRSRVRLGVSLDGRQGREYDAQGARIRGVSRGSPAEDAGLERGDIITHLDGRSLLDPLPSEEDEDELDEYQSLPVQRLMALGRELEDGQEVEVRYLRDGESGRVTLEAREMDSRVAWMTPGASREARIYWRGDPEAHWESGGDEGRVWHFRSSPRFRFFDDLEGLVELMDLEGIVELEDLDTHFPEFEFEFEGGEPRALRETPGIRLLRRGDGDVLLSVYGAGRYGAMELRTLNPELGEYFNAETGVLVLDVGEDTQLPFRAGDVVLAIDGRAVEDTGDFFRILRSYEEDEKVSFTILREGREMEVESTAG